MVRSNSFLPNVGARPGDAMVYMGVGGWPIYWPTLSFNEEVWTQLSVQQTKGSLVGGMCTSLPQHKNYYPNEMHNSSSNIFACHQPCNSVDNGWMKEEKLLLYVFSTLLGLICTQRRVNTTTDYCVMFLFAILLVCKLLTMACCP